MIRLTGVLAVFLAIGPATAVAEDVAAPAEDPTQVSGTWVNGVKGGASFATLSGDSLDDVGTHLGANVGYFFSYRIGNGIAIQPEVFITEKGASDAVLAETGRNADIIATYLELPVFGRYNLALAGDFKPYGYLGPVLSYNIDARRMVNTDGIDFDDRITNFDVGFAVGAGVDWNLGKETGLTLDARYSMGFLNIIDEDNNDASLTHRVFSVMFGIWK